MQEQDPESTPYGRKPYLSLFIVTMVLAACAMALAWVFFTFAEGFGALSRAV